MNNAITPYSQWMQNIKYDLMNMFQSYKTIFIHRAKIACLCQDLSQFHKYISAQHFPATPPQPNDATSLRQLVSAIAGLRQLFTALDAQHAIQTVFAQPVTYVKKYLHDFRQVFNTNVQTLGIFKGNPCPIDINQEKVDDLADCNELLDRLNGYASTTPLNPELQKTLDERIKELEEIVRVINEEQMEAENREQLRNRPLSADEVRQRLQELQKYNVRQEDFELQKKIGSGGFADVFIGYQRSTRKVVAIKKLHSNDFTESTYEMFKREVEIFGKLNHFAILPFVGVCLTPPYYIITEFMSGGCLFNRLHSRTDSHLDPTKRTIIALGIAYSLQYAHSVNLIHRDIKSLNVLLDADDFPKLCDFGMSREMAEKKELMTGGVGTAQWMAPEILNSEPYDEKSDVYSYGILLWELLTSDIPFRGMKDVQVAMAVISNQTRPIIPQDCPPKLNKFIKICWDQDPSRRPDFTTIARAIESGEVVYPGTNMTSVMAYITRFSRPASIPAPQSLINVSENASEQAVNELIKRLSGTETPSTIKFIVTLLGDKKWTDQFGKSKTFLNTLLDISDCCQDTKMAADIISIFAALSKNAELLPPGTFQRVFGLFMRFGNTEMVQILTFIENTMKFLTKSKINANVINKLAPFLQSANADIRIKMIQCCLAIMKYKAYDTIEAMRYIMPYAIANIAPESMSDILIPSITLVQLIVNQPALTSSFFDYDGVSHLASLIASSTCTEAIDSSYQVLSEILSTKSVPEKSLVSLVSGISAAVMGIHDYDTLIKYLAAISNCLGLKAAYYAFAKDDKVINAFIQLLHSKSPQVILITLKLCYAFLTRNETTKMFTQLVNEYMTLIESRVPAIASMASYCLVIAFPQSNKTNEFLNQSLQTFLETSLKSENIQSLGALRLTGAIANTKEGAQFLENNKIMSLVSKFIVSQNGLLQKVSIMVFASFSVTLPMSPLSIKVIPTFMQAMMFEQLSPYPLIFLSNVSIHPDGAILCAKSFEKFVAQLNSKDEKNSSRAVVTITHILSCHEAVSVIQNEDSVSDLYKYVTDNPTSPLIDPLIEIVAILCGTQVGRTALTKSTLESLLKEKLDTVNKDSPIRPTIMRILARC